MQNPVYSSPQRRLKSETDKPLIVIVEYRLSFHLLSFHNIGVSHFRPLFYGRSWSELWWLWFTCNCMVMWLPLCCSCSRGCSLFSADHSINDVIFYLFKWRHNANRRNMKNTHCTIYYNFWYTAIFQYLKLKWIGNHEAAIWNDEIVSVWNLRVQK